MSADSPCLEVDGLHVVFKSGGSKITAVDRVSFSLRQGKTLALVGESGCGKSVTALSLLRLIQKPGEIVGGHVWLRPRGEAPMDVLGLSTHDARLYRLRGGLAAMVFQEPQAALSPIHSIGSQLIEAVRLHRRISRQDAQSMAAEMLAELGMQAPLQRMQQYPHEFSGGMRQRAVIAMALLCRPQLLIADEPTTALDPDLRLKTFKLFKRMQTDHGMAMLLITHDLAAIADAADTVAVMYCGNIVEAGLVDEVMSHPRHPYTRALLESMPINSPRVSGRRLPTIPGMVPQPSAWPAGCRFHTRCREAVAGVCDTGAVPQLRRAANGHDVACIKVVPHG